MKEGLRKVAYFVHEYLMKTGKHEVDNVWGPKYRWEHTLRVAHWSWRLANEENANIEKCVIAAMLHDVSHFATEDYRKHGDRSAKIANDFLLKESYPDGFVEDVVYAVKSHVGEPNPRTIEAKILQDADTLDRFGAFRILLFGRTAELLDLEKLKERVQSFSKYLAKVERGEYGPMWTKSGERKLKELINIYKTVLKGVLEELQHTEAPETYLES